MAAAKPKTKAPLEDHSWGDIPLDLIDPSPWQTRTFRSDESDLAELVESVRASGVVQPIVVREVGARYELVAGERRTRASRLAGRTTIPAVVRDLTDEQAMELTVVENLQRRDLTAWEEAFGVRLLLEREGWTIEAVAAEIGYSPAWVARRAQIVQLSPAWQQAIQDPEEGFGTLGAGHLERVARLPHEFQDRLLAHGHLWHDYHHEEGRDVFAAPTLRKLDRAIESELHLLSSAPWSLGDEELLPKAGACTACPKRSGANALLWDAEPGAAGTDRCLDDGCFQAKLLAHLERRQGELKQELGKKPKLLSSGYQPARGSGPKKLQKLREGALSSWKVSKVKGPKVEGAEPYLLVDGPEAGHVVWATKSDQVHGYASSRVKPSGPKPLKERRIALRRRRLKLAIEGVEKAVWDATEAGEAPNLVIVAALAAAVGTKHDHEGAPSASGYSGEIGPKEYQVLPHGAWADRKKPPLPSLPDWPPKGVAQGRRLWPMVHAYQEAEGALRQDLWLAVWAVLSSRLTYQSHTDVELQWLEAWGVASLFGVDAQAILEEAEKTLPEPKTWALLKEDGTPKTAADKKATPAQTKRKPKRKRKAQEATA